MNEAPQKYHFLCGKAYLVACYVIIL